MFIILLDLNKCTSYYLITVSVYPIVYSDDYYMLICVNSNKTTVFQIRLNLVGRPYRYSLSNNSTLKINKGDKIEIKGTMQNSGNVVLIKPSSHQVKTISNQYVINKFNCHTNYKTRYNNVPKNVIDSASISCDV